VLVGGSEEKPEKLSVDKAAEGGLVQGNAKLVRCKVKGNAKIRDYTGPYFPGTVPVLWILQLCPDTFDSGLQNPCFLHVIK
jgi:hypothetical protein